MKKEVMKKSTYQERKYLILLLAIAYSFVFQACSREPKELPTNHVPSIATESSVVEPTLIVSPTITPTLAVQVEPDYIEWKDKNFEALIRVAIRKPTGKISFEEIKGIEDLCIVEKTLIISDLSEEEWSGYYFDIPTNARTYDIKDWSDLSYIKNLKHLTLVGNGLTNIEFLEDLTKIEFLNLKDNQIENYTPLSRLTSLRELYLGDTCIVSDLGFLRNLSIEKSDINWDKVLYPIHLTKEDYIEGISSGNLANIGYATCDGKNLYAVETAWGDLPHGGILQYDAELQKISYIDTEITEQMAQLWQCKPGCYMNERIASLNYYKNNIYYISNGTNNDTADCLGDGSYYLGDETFGIMKYDVTSKEKKLLTTETFQYLCAARDQLFGVNTKNEFVTMTLEGKDKKLVVKEHCSYAYVNEKVIYYLTAGKKKRLMCKKGESDLPELILEGDINKPVFLDHFVFYMDGSSYLYRYDMISKKTIKIYEEPIECYNMDQDNLYISSEKLGVSRVDLEGGNLTCLYESMTRNIQVVGDYLMIGYQQDAVKIKKDGTEFNVFYEYW